MCVCECVCERERERESWREMEREIRFLNLLRTPVYVASHNTIKPTSSPTGLSSSVEDSGNQFQFDRPRGGCETEGDCWGLVEFVDHKMISQPGFIKDDAIVLRCKIGFTSDKTRYRSRVE